MLVLNLALFGPPGSGKGTQSQILQERLGFAPVASGDLLRAEIKTGSPLGREIKTIMDRGELVPDAIVDRIVQNQVRKCVGEGRSIVFDGYPRNLTQLHKLEKMLEELQSDLHLAINLELDEDTLVRRMTSRRVCPSCKSVFNLITHPPRREGICDNCGEELELRPDDQPDAISTRFAEYHSQTEPMLNYLGDQGILQRIDADQTMEKVHEMVADAISDQRGQLSR